MNTLALLKTKHKNALIITAHPDDESLFMGGTIAEFKRWSWRLLCVTDCDERYNMARRMELLRACGIYAKHGSRIEPFMLGVTKRNGSFNKAEITEKINDFLRLAGGQDVIFTHDKAGEYGHKTHRLVHDAVRDAGLDGIYTFFCAGTGLRDKNGESVTLSDGSLSVKRQAVSLYQKGSQKTNLSRLRYIVNSALTSNIEIFRRFHY